MVSHSFHPKIRDRVWAAIVASSKKERTVEEIALWIDEPKDKVSRYLADFLKEGRVQFIEVERSAYGAYKAI